MNKILKNKILNIVLALVMMIGLIPITEAFAGENPVTEITTINIDNFSMPTYGKEVDLTVTAPEHCALATMENMHSAGIENLGRAYYWYDKSKSGMMNLGDTYDCNLENNYYARIVLDADPGYKFADNVTVTINGQPYLVGPESHSVNDGAFYIIKTKDITILPRYAVEMPFTLNVKNLGTALPDKETFNFVVTDASGEKTLMMSKDSITVENLKFTDNKASVEGNLRFEFNDEEVFRYLSDGIYVKMKPGKTDGWTYANEEWCIFVSDPIGPMSMMPSDGSVKLGVTMTVVANEAYPVSGEGFGEQSEEKMTFNVSYNKDKAPETPVKPETPAKPEAPAKSEAPKAPKTGDTNNMLPWMILLLGAAGTAAVVKTKKEK